MLSDFNYLPALVIIVAGLFAADRNSLYKVASFFWTRFRSTSLTSADQICPTTSISICLALI